MTQATGYKYSVGESYVRFWQDKWYDRNGCRLYIELSDLDRIIDSESRPEIVIAREGALASKDVQFLSDLTNELTGAYVYEPLTVTAEKFVKICRQRLPDVTAAAFLTGAAPGAVAKRLRAVTSDLEAALAKLEARTSTKDR